MTKKQTDCWEQYRREKSWEKRVVIGVWNNIFRREAVQTPPAMKFSQRQSLFSPFLVPFLCRTSGWLRLPGTSVSIRSAHPELGAGPHPSSYWTSPGRRLHSLWATWANVLPSSQSAAWCSEGVSFCSSSHSWLLSWYRAPLTSFLLELAFQWEQQLHEW